MSNTQRPNAAARHTVVEEGTEFKGALTSSCPIDVRGRIEGDVTTPALTVSATGAVHGRAKVGSVRSEGELSGEFDAESVELAGSVRDNTVIRARSLEVKLASAPGKLLQVTFGECELSIGAEPTDADEVAPVVAAAAHGPEPTPTEAVPGEAPAPVLEAALSDAIPPAATFDDEREDEPSAGDAAAPAGKRCGKKKEVVADLQSGWTRPPSHPPSQPPPAN
jgi:cytoskeletal protein CcmA (bactofilin family)